MLPGYCRCRNVLLFCCLFKGIDAVTQNINTHCLHYIALLSFTQESSHKSMIDHKLEIVCANVH